MGTCLLEFFEILIGSIWDIPNTQYLIQEMYGDQKTNSTPKPSVRKGMAEKTEMHS